MPIALAASSIAGVSCIVLLYLALPLLVVIAISFTETEYLKFPPQGLTLRWYWKVVSDPTFVEAFVVSEPARGRRDGDGAPARRAGCAGASRAEPSAARRALSALFLSPLVLPTIVLGVAILQYASALGFARSFWALYVGHVVLVTPYVIRTSIASLSGMEAGARGGGAGPRRHTPSQTFFLITLPQIKPGVIAGALFAFINSWINVEVSIFNSTAQFVTIPVKLFNYIQFNIDPTLAAVSAATIYIAILVVVAIDLAVGIEKAAVNTTADARS